MPAPTPALKPDQLDFCFLGTGHCVIGDAAAAGAAAAAEAGRAVLDMQVEAASLWPQHTPATETMARPDLSYWTRDEDPETVLDNFRRCCNLSDHRPLLVTLGQQQGQQQQQQARPAAAEEPDHPSCAVPT